MKNVQASLLVMWSTRKVSSCSKFQKNSEGSVFPSNWKIFHICVYIVLNFSYNLKIMQQNIACLHSVCRVHYYCCFLIWLKIWATVLQSYCASFNYFASRQFSHVLFVAPILTAFKCQQKLLRYHSKFGSIRNGKYEMLMINHSEHFFSSFLESRTLF